MTKPKKASTLKKNRADSTTISPTITEVIQVSRQLVQVTLRASARTSREKRTMSKLRFGPASAGGEVRACDLGRIVVGMAPGFLAMNAFANFPSPRRESPAGQI